MNTYALEMFLAVVLVTIGVTLIWPGDTFGLDHYASVYNWVPETLGGAVLAVIGMLRVTAILRNGRTQYTPVIRIAGCSLGAGFWASLVAAVELSTATTGTPLILPIALTAVCFELYSALRGGADAHALDSLGFKKRKTAVLRNDRQTY